MKVFTKSVWQMTADGMQLVPEECESYDYEGPLTECKGGKAPKTPDPNVVSAAQTQSNTDTAAYQNALNHGNVSTPYGSQTFTGRVDPTTGATVYDQSVSLSPGQQQLYDQQQQQNLQLGRVGTQMLGGIQNAYGSPMDTSGLPALADRSSLYGADDLEGARKSVSDALYQRQSSYLDPQYQQRENDLTTRLANQGVVEGSEAWRNARDQFGRERAFDYDQARTSSITGGLNEMQGLSGIALNNAGFQNNARAQSLQELLTRRNQPLNEFNALRQNTQVDTPQFQNPNNAQVAPTDTAGNIWNSYNGQLGIYNARQNQQNGLLGGLMGLGGALGSSAIMSSDKRVKSNIKRIGLLPQGVGLYTYEYDGDPQHERQTGVMAQEVEKDDPDAVITGEDGFKKVDYSRVLAKALAEAA